MIGPLSRKLVASGAIDRWFFIRYADPDEHVRWRLHVAAGTGVARVQRRIETAAAALISAGRTRRLVFDTYDREVERYGGPAGIEAAERCFWADSEAVLDVLDSLGDSNAGADLRWQVAIPGVDALLTDFELDLEAKLRLMQKQRAAFGREFRAEAALGRQLGVKFRGVRADLEKLLEPATAATSPDVWRDALSERSTRTRAELSALHSSARAGLLDSTLTRLAAHFVHMHLNRLFRAQQRAHELTIYDFLVRLYDARLARRRASAT